MSLASAAERPWSLEREIVLARVYDAPRALVFKMWTDPEHFSKWLAPTGFTMKFLRADIRPARRAPISLEEPMKIWLTLVTRPMR